MQNPNSSWFKEECDDGNMDNTDNCQNNCLKPWQSQPSWLELSCSLNLNKYADWSDSIIIKQKFFIDKAIINNKDILWLGNPIPGSFVDLSKNYSDRINRTWVSSLKFTPLEIDWNPNLGQTQEIAVAKVSSVTPFASCGNKVSFKIWEANFLIDNIWYFFKKPLVWILESDLDVRLWTKNNYKLSSIKKSSFLPNPYELQFTKNNVFHLWSDIALQDTKLLPYSQNARSFETRINSSNYATRLNNSPWLQVISPIISYTLDNKNVRYYLSKHDYPNDRTPIDLSWDKFLWIKIIWTLQWDWKYEFTWQDKNISDVLVWEVKTQIRKNAFTHIRNMESWRILKWVYYKEWDLLSSEVNLEEVETIVVKDWNFIIGEDLNSSNKKLWIIVLKDWYNVKEGYKWEWNVYVKPNVKTINAIIYADGWFISVWGDNKPYEEDTVTRTTDLQKQLMMNWSLFTRNTIWWSQYVWWYYTLPWWLKVPDFISSMNYDLNYIRRWNQECTRQTTWQCLHNEWFIIKYDSRIQTSPPKLFFD